MRKINNVLCGMAVCLALTTQSQAAGHGIDTRLGTLTFDERGMPTAATSELLFDWLDFQYGVQTFMWSLPLVGMEGWRQANIFHGATGEMDMVAYGGYEGSMGVMTPTSNVTYVFAFPILSKTGPVVWEIPPGEIVGSVQDFWQRAQGDFGLPGPDKGQGTKLLILGAQHELPQGADGYRVIKLPTNTAVLGLRILNPDEVADLSSKLRLYAFAERNNPPASKLIFAKGKAYDVAQPKGMAYWQRLNDLIQREPVEERDRFYMAMLRQIGIEKGKPFAPSEGQHKTLEAAAIVGEKMAMTNSFDRFMREESARFGKGTQWKYVLSPEVPTQRGEYYESLEERASYTYEGIATSEAMVPTKPGGGSGYVGVYRSSDGQWFDGAETYRLKVPANPPAKQFWSITVYDTVTRSFLQNETKVVEAGSRTKGLVTNSDGTVDLYFGPKAPAGKEANWVQTVPGKGWFAFFRFYGPMEGYLNGTWTLPDIEKVSAK